VRNPLRVLAEVIDGESEWRGVAATFMLVGCLIGLFTLAICLVAIAWSIWWPLGAGIVLGCLTSLYRNVTSQVDR
jgi:hypothetical protein